MIFDGYFTEQDDVLENWMGIDDPVALQKVEDSIVPVRTMEMLSSPPAGEMDFSYLKQLHYHLFSDIYPMAGKVRTLDIAKGNSVFCYARFIDDEQKRIFAEMKRNFGGRFASRESFASALARLSADLNALHPFCEGNGRTIRLFLNLLAERKGYLIDFEKVPKEDILRADIAGFHGDLAPLERLYSAMLSDGMDTPSAAGKNTSA